MNEMLIGRATLLALRDAFDMALTELEELEYSDSVDTVRESIETIDAIMDERYLEYEDDEYDDTKQATSELRFD